MNSIEYKKLPVLSVYSQETNLGIRWCVKENDSDSFMGDTIHQTEKDAQEYADFEKLRRKERLESELAAQQKELENQQKEKEYLESFGGFLDCSPMKAGRLRKTLERKVRYGGVIYTRKELAEKLVAEGNWIETVGNETRLYSSENVFLSDMTKTFFDYCKFLIK